jgi:acyl-CoA reductase-like NAD-dependent aldehyde dehydrogenase
MTVELGEGGRPLVGPRGLFIDGGWREAVAGQRRDVIDPSTGRVITTVAEGAAADVDAAVAAARQAFDEGPWGRTTPRERARVLARAAERLRERADELVAIESLDVGKPVTLCRMVDVNTTIEIYEYYAGLAQGLEGSTRQTPLPAMAYTLREPVGVVGAITPFNFPLVLSSTKIAPALAAGNTIVHKPAEETPLSALWMAELLADAGVPEGVLNIVTGGGPGVGDPLVRHPGVDKIAFTGSTAVGRHIAGLAGAGLKPVTVELGGKSAHLIFEDADIEKAVGAAIEAFVFNTGQFCMAGSRLLVARPVYDAVVQAVAAGAAHVPVGDPFDASTVVGPMVGERHLRKVEEYVRCACDDDRATVLTGGARLPIVGGCYFPPTVLSGVGNDARVVQEEIFGPVVTVQAFDTEEEAIRMANSTPFGLAAGLHTREVARAHRVAQRLRAGIVWVNSWGMLDPAIPFGGCKQSGFGREYGPEGMHEYTQVKSVIVSLV